MAYYLKIGPFLWEMFWKNIGIPNTIQIFNGNFCNKYYGEKCGYLSEQKPILNQNDC